MLSPFPSPAAALAILLAILVGTSSDAHPGVLPNVAGMPIPPSSGSLPQERSGAEWALPGREEDGRVAAITFRLARAGVARCSVTQPLIGLVLQHLSQFQLADRPGMISALKLDRGPVIMAIAPNSPAAMAGLRPGDVLLAINDRAIPNDAGLDREFDATMAHARADAVEDLLRQAAAAGSYRLTIAHDDRLQLATIIPSPGCPSRIRLARSRQRNAYADGDHVLLTTGLVDLLRNNDELAFVIAHEMAHNILGHAAIMRSGAIRHGLGRTWGRSGAAIRTIEREADTLAGEIMLDAAYDPIAGAAMLRRLDTDLGLSLFSSHDTPAVRIALLRGVVEKRRQP